MRRHGLEMLDQRDLVATVVVRDVVRHGERAAVVREDIGETVELVPSSSPPP
jgi:hypothetical protein